MRIAVYSPYLPKHAGGGEKHMLTSAALLSKEHEVELLVAPDMLSQVEAATKRYEALFSLDLSRVKWVGSRLAARTRRPWETWQETRRYDVLLALTDGSLFWAGARRNIFHIQVPFTHSLSGWLNRSKLRTWDIINTNSEFTKAVIERSWRITVDVVHTPYVDTANIAYPPQKSKGKKILAVGRFYDPQHTDLHAKRQDLLIEAFRKGCAEFQWDTLGWELHLVGAVEPGTVHEAFVKKLKAESAGLPIHFWHDIPDEELDAHYQTSSFFWHAAGYGIDEALHPAKVEHFGMSVIEAQARGCIPLVCNRGGLKETVQQGKSGFLFETLDELIAQTEELRRKKRAELQPIQDAARTQAEQYSLERFSETLQYMLHAPSGHHQ